MPQMKGEGNSVAWAALPLKIFYVSNSANIKQLVGASTRKFGAFGQASLKAFWTCKPGPIYGNCLRPHYATIKLDHALFELFGDDAFQIIQYFL